MPWGVVAGAAIGLVGSAVSANGAESAASTQANAATNAANMQMQQYQQTQNEYAPQRALGTGADSLLAQLYGINLGGSVGASQNPSGPTPSSTYNPIAGAAGGASSGSAGGSGTGALNGPAGTVNPNFSSFYNSPGYQFSLQQGENAINRSAAAGGNAYSTSTMAGLDQFAQGQASTQYNSYVNQLLQQAGLGSAATAGTASAGTAAAEGASNSVISAGNANASGILGASGQASNFLNGQSNNVANGVNNYMQTSQDVNNVSAAENSGQYSLEKALG
jgi:hypothetical protein